MEHESTKLLHRAMSDNLPPPELAEPWFIHRGGGIDDAPQKVRIVKHDVVNAESLVTSTGWMRKD